MNARIRPGDLVKTPYDSWLFVSPDPDALDHKGKVLRGTLALVIAIDANELLVACDDGRLGWLLAVCVEDVVADPATRDG